MLYHPSELHPLPNNKPLARQFLDEFPSAAPLLSAARYIPSPAHARLWDLVNLIIPFTNPDPPWIEEPLTSMWPGEFTPEAMHAQLAQLLPSTSEPVYIGLESPDATLFAPFSFALDHLLATNTAWTAAPPDAAWLVVDYYAEFVLIVRTAFHRIADLAFYRRYPIPDGRIVDKLQYLIRLTSGHVWLTDDLRDPDRRQDHDQLFAFLSARSGKPINNHDVLPVELTSWHKRRAPSDSQNPST